MRPRGGARWVAGIAALAVVAWSLGFLWFVQVAVHRTGPPPPAHADGVVALTGGAGRVELALRLLAAGQADKLLLSGIGGGTELSTLGRMAGIDTAKLAPRVTVGRYASSTLGNAVETAAWAAQNDISTLIVVTAAFHMPRALAELHRALPDVALFPLPVPPGKDGTERGPGLRLEMGEFAKYLLAVSGLSAWLPHREAPAALHPSPGSEE
ncbi:YdcF family protein [Rhodopila globiformis]|uniref:DUF218 domain-containing protein n=1 Tax=Rhodopila globiformis TaxID=1071 RepID=A0A2S6N2Q2_RHOGL|nr:YdcF family protein [Rhodopila globiformis]PPQ28879.1 hypothetical protein CCS01_23160 [Rhodopila globiformis]